MAESHLLRSFERFQKYISGRESSLKRTFDRLDADGDGQLTVEEVRAGLATFGFTCPFSRCVYKTKQQVLCSLVPLSTHLKMSLHTGPSRSPD